ncbi:hypothetical protein TNCV_1727181 [Trichonephila clavipes]|nr:hypothetical protein TNCV_1727181 [Trichonephila clavipes]
MISRFPIVSISNPLTEVEKLICSTMSLSETVLFFREKIVGMQTRITDRSLEFIHSEIPTENGGSSMGITATAMDITTSPNFDLSGFE